MGSEMCIRDRSFDVPSREELSRLVEKIRQVESVIDVERTTG